ncbi:hypothetical protein P5673_031322 [Acropora cervicornis]|uniref:ZMYM2-like/QRICH1 C-terminal domain-containing protein n=1 Tax=Acropora cervicornis TaxID=6130 RepID=A0AAD9PSZ3_ACRCE|nr:hypothetical protein P5673_031322 [Acropora cervicornis]
METSKDGPEGREYVEWVIEQGSKTHTGKHEFVPDRKFNPKMFVTDGPHCPVKIFKEYLARRLPEMASADSPLYLASISKPLSHIWFKRQPLGKNSLGSFMKSMSEASGCYSGTSTKQQKDISLKLSCCVKGEERHKSVAKSRVLTAKQQGQNGGHNLFSGAVFNNCNFTFTPAEAGFSCDNGVPSAKKFKR